MSEWALFEWITFACWFWVTCAVIVLAGVTIFVVADYFGWMD